jgi:membrane protein
MPRFVRTLYDAYWRFVADDGWAIASHIALSMLMSLFPFLIFLTALAGWFGRGNLADEATDLLLETWPRQVADPIAQQIRAVIDNSHRGVLTFGVVFALYFSSNGVEALRVALNRSYGLIEHRPWWLTRLESVFYVLVSAITLLAISFLVVLGPILWAIIVQNFPLLGPYGQIVTATRFLIATLITVAALIVLHLYLPCGKRRINQVWPGILVTLVLALGSGAAFGFYLTRAASNYVATYAGLASVMIALVFLYTIAAVFIYGGSVNALLLGRSNEPPPDMGETKLDAERAAIRAAR